MMKKIGKGRVGQEEFFVSRKMKERGYVYAAEFFGDDRLLYFRTLMDLGRYLWDEPTTSVRWSGKIDDLEAL